MGSWRGRVVSEPKPTEPDAELLEFLGGIDEVNDETQDEDLTEVLAKADRDKPEAKKPKAPVKEEKIE
jgi:hypothetical protein